MRACYKPVLPKARMLFLHTYIGEVSGPAADKIRAIHVEGLARATYVQLLMPVMSMRYAYICFHCESCSQWTLSSPTPPLVGLA